MIKRVKLIIAIMGVGVIVSACGNSNTGEVTKVENTDVIKEQAESVENINSSTDEVEVVESETVVQEILEGEWVIVEDVAEFVIEYTEINEIAKPTIIDGVYGYYEAEEGNTYVDVCISIKSLMVSEIRPDELMSGKLIYEGKYEYAGLLMKEEDKRTDLVSASITRISPLSHEYVRYLFEVPESVVNDTAGSIIIELNVGEQIFSYDYRAAVIAAFESETKRQANAYNQALELIESNQYHEAYKLLSEVDAETYPDKNDLMDYCMGVICYKEYKVYGEALFYLERAKGILDATTLLQEVLSLVAPYNGTYYADDLEYPGMGIGSFLFIKDGKAVFEHESTYTAGSKVYYMDSIAEKTFTDGSSGLMIGSFSIFDEDDTPEEEDYEYSFMEGTDGDYLVIAYETNPYTTFNGLYTKISDEIPDAE